MAWGVVVSGQLSRGALGLGVTRPAGDPPDSLRATDARLCSLRGAPETAPEASAGLGVPGADSGDPAGRRRSQGDRRRCPPLVSRNIHLPPLPHGPPPTTWSVAPGRCDLGVFSGPAPRGVPVHSRLGGVQRPLAAPERECEGAWSVPWHEVARRRLCGWQQWFPGGLRLSAMWGHSQSVAGNS